MGLVQGQALFNISVSNIDIGIECTSTMCANQCDMNELLEERDAILARLERWAHVNLMKFKKANCKVLHLVWGNPKYKYRQGGLGTALRRMTWGCWWMRGWT